MFENPNKNMEDMEQQLLAAENEAEDFESFFAQIMDEFGDKSAAEDKETQNDQPEERNEAAPVCQDKQAKAAPVKKDHSIRNLTALIVLELLGIAGVAAWWVMKLL